MDDDSKTDQREPEQRWRSTPNANGHADSPVARVPGAWRESAVLLAVAVLLGLCGSWVDAPMRDAGCEGVVPFELALPRTRAAAPSPTDDAPATDASEAADEPLPASTVRGLRTIDGVVAECGGDTTRIGSALRSSVGRDWIFMCLYVPALAWCCARAAGHRRGSLARVDTTEGVRNAAHVAAWFAIGAGVLDAVENRFLLRTAGRLDEPRRSDVILTGAAAGAKFLLLVLPVAVTFWMLGRLVLAWMPNRRTAKRAGRVQRWIASRRPASADGASADAAHTREVPATASAVSPWDVPLAGASHPSIGPMPADDDRYGICLSGGGIRSATFALGGLQRLEALETPSPWRLSAASYLAAVSGGSYLAASYQFLARGGVAADALGAAAATAAAPGPYVPPSGAVEDHLRRHSTHLADGAKEWLLAVGEILLKALSGLAILLGVLWIVALPLGWLYRSWLHGLDEGQPAPTLGLETGLVVAFVFVVFVVLRSLVSIVLRVLGDGAPVPVRDTVRQSAGVAAAAAVAVVIVLPFLAPRVEDIADRVGRATGLAEPKPEAPRRGDVVEHLSRLAAATSTAGARAAEAAAALDGDPASAGALRAAVATAETAASVARRVAADLEQSVEGIAAPDRLTIEPVADAATSCAPPEELDEPSGLVILACQAANASATAAGAAASLARVVSQSTAEPGVLSDVLVAANESSAAAARAAVEVAALGTELDRQATGGPPSDEPPLAWAGLSALVTIVGGVIGKRRMDVGKGPTPAKKSGRGNAIARKLGFGGVSEVIAGVACAVVLVIAASDVLVDAWRRGPSGELTIVDTQPSVVWWGAAAAVILVLFGVLNVNTWSLRDFYHRRLWLAYAVTPEGKTAAWQTDTRLSELGRKVDGFPELLVCAAAQTSGRHWAPPGRRAVSFVFTATMCGGPRVEYVSTAELEAFLGRRYRKPLTLFGAVATSGAAFGPAMGRQSKGGLGAVLAIANARLGAWLPNPRRLRELAALPAESWRVGALPRRPGLRWWFREIMGRYPLDNAMVLTTDGGHIENLGLVELLRRRCGRILCFDASGAGATPTTLAEAIVLAREELGVRIELFAPNGDPLLDAKEFGADPLRRSPKDEAKLGERLARFPVVAGTIHYPAVDVDGTKVPASTGQLIYGTLGLTDRTTWDVLEYAQRNPTFPNDGTDKQWFRANTFAAYQQLGRDVADAMLATAAAFPASPTVLPTFPGGPTPPRPPLDWHGGVVIES